ncbi:MAG TPA: DUF1761 domain-containing protein [Candidatus Saccharimonadales bacterium]
MNIEINWLAVTIATILSLVLARTWYRDRLFGSSWRKITGITPKDSQKAGMKPMAITLVANIITVITMAVVLSAYADYSDDNSVASALLIGFIMWLAFSATTLATHNAFEQKREKLTAINNGYQLALFLVVSGIIGLIGY